jgi:hypothetical protein
VLVELGGNLADNTSIKDLTTAVHYYTSYAILHDLLISLHASLVVKNSSGWLSAGMQYCKPMSALMQLPD